MLNIGNKLQKTITISMKLLPLISMVIPILILYFYQDVAFPAYPYYYEPDANSFEVTWKGRTFYLFFLWLISLEMILGWEELHTEKHKLKSIRTVALIVTLLLPTIYAVYANFYGLNREIVDLAYSKEIKFGSDWVPLAIEYLVFTVLFALTIFVGYGFKGLMNFSISIFFLGIIGLLYTTDNLYPYGQFTPFQFLVFPTATLAANVLNLMGYQTSLSLSTSLTSGWMPILTAQVPGYPLKSATFGIGWPCAGIESLLIFTVTILLFLKKSVIPSWQRIAYFVFGALVTYFINILRIATIFVIQINEGTLARIRFHDYYGQLYSFAWIISYPLMIIGSRALWRKIRKKPASTN